MNALPRSVRAALVLVALALATIGGLSASPAYAADRPAPRWVHLTTRPALPGATFDFDGSEYTTGADGTVLIMTSSLTGLEARMHFVSVRNAPLTSAHFDHFETRPEQALTREAVAVFDMSRFLHLTTIPSLPNATFHFDGQTHTTGADGTVTIDTATLTDISQRLSFDSVATDPLTSAQFVRFDIPPQNGYWRDAVAVFDVSRGVQFSFTDPSGGEVPLARVTSMKIRSSTGVERTFSSDTLRQPIMLPAVHVLSSAQNHAPQMLRYTVQEVMADGSNTVTPSQHEFFPARDAAVQVDTLFFTVRVSARDALFGFANGSTVTVRAPDGSETRYPLQDGQVTIESVARGDYQLRVEGAGIANWRPIAVSRSQTVELQPISHLDLGAAAAAVVLVFGGLLLLGSRRRSRRRRRIPPSGDAPEGQHSSLPPPPRADDGADRMPEPVG